LPKSWALPPSKTPKTVVEALLTTLNARVELAASPPPTLLRSRGVARASGLRCLQFEKARAARRIRDFAGSSGGRGREDAGHMIVTQMSHRTKVSVIPLR
jgi:hypothetical protein